MTSFYSLGLMSGSSLDGLDICYSRIDEENEIYNYKIIAAETIEYPLNILNQLKTCREMSETSLTELDLSLGEFYGNACLDFISKFKIHKLDFIASHGHTVFHFPEKKYTLQIGNGQTIANLSQVKTIYQLRQKDIDMGGSGAPIVPIGDLLFFPQYKYCLNLGGIMNISEKKENNIISYDIGVCNQIINHYSQILGFEFDRDGELGRNGEFNSDLFNLLNSVDYFQRPYPKSLDNGFSIQLIHIIEGFDISINDKLHTFYHHIAYQIKKVCTIEGKLLCTGGGSHNLFLIELLMKKQNLDIVISSNDLINYKEALIMSLIGVRFLENKFNVIASVTGASENTICGNIKFPIS